mgnify:CR=1 FL=1
MLIKSIKFGVLPAVILVILATYSFALKPACFSADFTNSSDEYAAGEPITLEDLSSAGSGASYAWVYNGREISTDVTCKFTDYEYDTDYDLSLRVTKAACDDIVYKTFRVVMNEGGNGVVIWP